ncbi:hypothetical protein DL93DRAFT_2100063 [Clavulina sp. PMI_390]|nr:hypothetical protein DL93DRAFT_2100063 [Clavulina sp. PMI_390]
MSQFSVAHPELIKLREINGQLAVVALPPELLSEVFLECIDRGALSDVEPQRSIKILRKNRTSLAGVCYRWRRIAQATPMLWAVTSFSGQFTEVKDDEGSNSYKILPEAHKPLHHELQLSSTVPVSLVSQSKTDHLLLPSALSMLKHEVCAALSPILPRCDRLFLEAPSSVPFLVLNAAPEKLASLRLLDVRASRGDSMGHEIRELNLTYAKSIRHLSIRSHIYRSPPETISPIIADPTKLKTLTISGFVDYPAAYEIISQATSLHSLMWLAEYKFLRFTVPPQQISMYSLQHLTLDGMPPLSLLPHLDAPQLVSATLTLHGSFWVGSSTLFLKPSQAPCLRSLTLGPTYAASPMLQPLLPEFRALQVLNLRCELKLELAAACANIDSLRLVVFTWLPVFRPWDGPLKLLEGWSSHIDSGEISSLSRGICFVCPQVTMIEERAFRDTFLSKFPAVKISLCKSSPFSLWGSYEWDELFAQFDADPLYLPPFLFSSVPNA